MNGLHSWMNWIWAESGWTRVPRAISPPLVLKWQRLIVGSPADPGHLCTYRSAWHNRLASRQQVSLSALPHSPAPQTWQPACSFARPRMQIKSLLCPGSGWGRERQGCWFTYHRRDDTLQMQNSQVAIKAALRFCLVCWSGQARRAFLPPPERMCMRISARHVAPSTPPLSARARLELAHPRR